MKVTLMKKTILILLFATLFSGCGSPNSNVKDTDYYYLNPLKDLSKVGRVALVQLENNSEHYSISETITSELHKALQKKQVFGLSLIYPKSPEWTMLDIDIQPTYNLKQIAAIRSSLKADALLTGTITEYKPFPHAVIGLRLRLIDLTDGQLIWALEQIWDSTDKTTQSRIENYLKEKNLTTDRSMEKQLVNTSPLKFTKFVTYEVSRTIETIE